MTEAEWLACDDPGLLLDHVEGKVSDRKLLLFAVACCRSIWHLFSDEVSRRAVATTELYADGLITESDLTIAAEQAGRASETERLDWLDESDPSPAIAAWLVSCGPAFDAAYACGTCAVIADRWRQIGQMDWWKTHQREGEVEGRVQVALFQDIFANPFKPVTLSSECLTPAVVSLAQTIYDTRAFDRLPDLAAALERAGCTNADLLAHCRSPGPHARGCWAVDLVLGKS